MGFTTEPQHRSSVSSSVDKTSARSTMSSASSTSAAMGDAVAAAKILQLRLAHVQIETVGSGNLKTTSLFHLCSCHSKMVLNISHYY
jgi:hypothetical protein